MIYQQGDVIMETTNKVVGKPLPHLTLATGEATGHAHTVTTGDAELYCDEAGNITLGVKSASAVVTHQEHGTVTLPRGKYKIRKVVEYDHFAEEAREVRD